MKSPSLKGLSGSGVKIAIGVVAGLVVVVGGFLLVQNVFTKASDAAPRDIVINGVAANAAKISWTTDQETQAVIEYGSSPTSLNLFAPETQKQKTHTVDLTLLSPNTSYYFQIRIGETKHDNGGVPWMFSTKSNQAGAGGTPTATPSGALTPTHAGPTQKPVPTMPGSVLTPISTTITPQANATIGPLPTSSLRVPTAVPTVRVLSTSTPVPTVYVVPTLPLYTCGETDCQKVCLKIGATCSTQDWMRSICVGKMMPGSCYWITPTLTPTPSPTLNPLTPTLSPTATPTSTPTPSPTGAPTNTPGPTTPSYMN